MRRRIAIVTGGDSSEHGVSMRSAQGISSFLADKPYDVYIVEIIGQKWTARLSGGSETPVDRNDFSFVEDGKRVRPDFAYITIHGTPGENGILAGYFELIGMPHSTCDVLVGAMTFDKYVLNRFLRSLGVDVSDSVLLRRGQSRRLTDKQIVERLGLPCFVKPNAGGSSFGVTKVRKTDELEAAIDKAMQECPEVLVEAFLDGVEISCGCYKTNGVARALPITEVVSDNDFFDYDAKYNGQVSEITPARLAPGTTARVQAKTVEIYETLGCRGFIRVDYILTGDRGNEKINMLEVNTTPGMTATSFIPQQIISAGMKPGDVFQEIIEDILKNRRKQ